MTENTLRPLLTLNYEYQWKMKGDKHHRLHWNEKNDGDDMDPKVTNEATKDEKCKDVSMEEKKEVTGQKLSAEVEGDGDRRVNTDRKKKRSGVNVTFEASEKGVLIEEVHEERLQSNHSDSHGTVKEMDDGEERKEGFEEYKNVEKDEIARVTEAGDLIGEEESEEIDPFSEYREGDLPISSGETRRIKHTSSVSAEMSQIHIIPEDEIAKVCYWQTGS